MLKTFAYILYITISPVEDGVYSLHLNDPFPSEQSCNTAGKFVIGIIHNDLKIRFPDTNFIFNIECKKQEKIRT